MEAQFKKELYTAICKEIQNLFRERIGFKLQIKDKTTWCNSEYYKNIDKKHKELCGEIETVSGLNFGQLKLEDDFLNVFSSRSGQDIDWECVSRHMKRLYRKILLEYPQIHRRKFLECVDSLQELLAAHCLVTWMGTIMEETTQPEEELFWGELSRLNKIFEEEAREKQFPEEHTPIACH